MSPPKEKDVWAVSPYPLKQLKPHQFIGREEQLAALSKEIHEAPANQRPWLAVGGPRRIGKTSLLAELVRRLLERRGGDTQYAFAKIDLLGLEHLEDVEQILLRELGRIHFFESATTLAEIFRLGHNHLFVFIVDEINSSDPNIEPLLAQIAVKIKEWCDEGVRAVGIFAIEHASNQFKSDKLLYWFQNLHVVEVGAFNEAEARQALTDPVKKQLYDFSEKALEEAVKQSGRLPLCINAIGTALFERRRKLAQQPKDPFKDPSKDARAEVQKKELRSELYQQASQLIDFHLQWFWQGLEVRQRLACRALAGAYKLNESKSDSAVQQVLLKAGFDPATIEKAVTDLTSQHFVLTREEVSAFLGGKVIYRFTAAPVHLWLKENQRTVKDAEEDKQDLAHIYLEAGDRAFYGGDAEIALDQYRRAEATKLGLRGARIGIARCLDAKGQHLEAIQRFEMLRHAQREDVDLHLATALWKQLDKTSGASRSINEIRRWIEIVEGVLHYFKLNQLQREELEQQMRKAIKIRDAATIERLKKAMRSGATVEVQEITQQFKEESAQQLAIDSAKEIAQELLLSQLHRQALVLLMVFIPAIHQLAQPNVAGAAGKTGLDSLFAIAKDLLQRGWKAKDEDWLIERITFGEVHKILSCAAASKYQKELQQVITMIIKRRFEAGLQKGNFLIAERAARLYFQLNLEAAAQQQLDQLRTWLQQTLPQNPVHALYAWTRLALPLAKAMGDETPLATHELILTELARGLKQLPPSVLSTHNGLVDAIEPLLDGRSPKLEVLLKKCLAGAVAREQHLYRPGDLLLSRYEILAELPIGVAGQNTANLRLYRCKDRDQSRRPGADASVCIKVFPLTTTSQEGVQLQRWLWEKEQRALRALSVHDDSVALTRFIAALEDKTKQRNDLLVITSDLGPYTLRDLLDVGNQADPPPQLKRVVEQLGLGQGQDAAKVNRAHLWQQLCHLLRAVQKLHRARIVHRNLSPDVVHLRSNAPLSPLVPWFSIAHFEWSIYLHDLAHLSSGQSSLQGTSPVERWTHYHAPEVLANVLKRKADEPPDFKGEGPAADLFSLGLLLYECLVAPIPDADRHVYRPGDDYSKSAHRAWIDQLRATVDESRQLQPLEKEIIKELLHYDLLSRNSDLDTLTSQAAHLFGDSLQHSLRSGGALVAVTVMKELRGVLSKKIDLSAEPDDTALAGFLSQELQGGQVYRNGQREGFPLLIRTPRLWFRAKPFVHDGMPSKQFAFVELDDPKEGSVKERLAALPVVFALDHLDLHARFVQFSSASQYGSWELLFNQPEALLGAMKPEHRRTLRFIELLHRVESYLWNEQVFPYVIVGEPTEEGHEEVLWIAEDKEMQETRRKRGDFLRTPKTLIDFLRAEFAQDGTAVELGANENPSRPFFRGLRFSVSGFVEDALGGPRVELRRELSTENREARPNGWLRPWSMAQSVPLFRRREFLEQHLTDDTYLLDALAQPEMPFFELGTHELPLFDTRIAKDPEKNRALRTFLQTIPLFLVQGPPGTGKTTLACEVVRQLFRERPFTRILVTSQSHDPLNNLLKQIIEADAEKPEQDRPSLVRLMPPERLDPKKHGEKAQEMEQFTPANSARTILNAARGWNPKSEELRKLVPAWQATIENELKTGPSAQVERRICESANIVYATCNDRNLVSFESDPFDVAIIEEAGKANASELLLPMHLSRRWFLIGDQAQLPPYRVDDMTAVLDKLIDQISEEEEAGTRITRLHDDFAVRSKTELILEFSRRLYFFKYLFETAQAGRKAKLYVTPETYCTLQTHYRFHPEIGMLVQKVFYPKIPFLPQDEQAQRKDKRHGFKSPVQLAGKQLAWLDITEGQESRSHGGGFINLREVEAILLLLHLLQPAPDPDDPEGIALLSPYKGQIQLLRSHLRSDPKLSKFESCCYTVDASQGRQWKTVILSLVRSQKKDTELRPNKGVGFLQKPERLNVMCSRAECLLLIVGNSAHFKRYEAYCKVHEVATYIDQQGGKLQSLS